MFQSVMVVGGGTIYPLLAASGQLLSPFGNTCAPNTHGYRSLFSKPHPLGLWCRKHSFSVISGHSATWTFLDIAVLLLGNTWPRLNCYHSVGIFYFISRWTVVPTACRAVFLISRGNLTERTPLWDACTQKFTTLHPKHTAAQPPWEPFLPVEKDLTPFLTF